MEERMSCIKSVILCLIVFLFVALFTTVDFAYAATKTPGLVKITTIQIEDNGGATAHISWKKAKNAKKYEIYYKYSDEKKWSCTKTSKLKANLYFQFDEAFQFKIRGINGKKKGKFSKIKTITRANPYRENCKIPVYNVGDTVDFDDLTATYPIPKHRVTITETQFNVHYDSYWYHGITEEGLPFSAQSSLQYKKNDSSRITIIGEPGSFYSHTDIPQEGYDWTCEWEGDVDYRVAAWKDNIKIYWTIDGTEPVVDQDDKYGKVPCVKWDDDIKIRGTVSYGEGIVEICDTGRNYSVKDSTKGYTVWIKAYQDGKYIGEVYRHMGDR